MKKIIINSLAVIALTIGASQAKAQLASDAPSLTAKPAPLPVAKPAAQVETASSSNVSVSAKAAVTTIAQPAQGDVKHPSLAAARASAPAPALPLQEGQQPKEAAAKAAIKAELPSQQN